MDRTVMDPADQGQVHEVSGAAIQPGDQMMSLTPGNGPLAVGEDAAAVARGQGDALGGLDDPGGAAHVQGLAGGTTQDRGQHGRRRPQPSGQIVVAARAVSAGGMVLAVGMEVAAGRTVAVVIRGVAVVLVATEVMVVVAVGCWWLGCWRVTRTRVTVPSQASR
jgi:hypothetical protein